MMRIKSYMRLLFGITWLGLAPALAQQPNGGTEKLFFYHHDHLGSTTYVTDENGDVVQHIEYLPSGEVFIEECDTKEKLNEREIYWISFYDCMSPKGYNLTPGGYINYSLEIGRQLSKINKGKKRSPEVIAKISVSKKGHPVSEETREKISKANKGKKLSPETCAKMSAGRKNKRAVVCLETGQIFESVSAAARWAKVESCTVSATVNGRTASAGGFHWLFADADVKDDEIELKPLRAGKRSVRCVETDEIFESITAAAQFANASSGNIQRVLNKSNRTAGGYHWVDAN